ncbi:glycosyltransferase family 4 protein [Lysobacter sp. H21R4]|uniref:glycosyltransferase family 4 protein n=1 Tax=Lysobacter sp. H21R4 TaxID=2781021 RepID=UPI001887594D|nr:glycosyltransferase family 4 protein [Lysobacter sp. H21R4]QOY62932.1 glycosyltransferase family 4 protein [Lysobacter sp. H21R4]
MKLLLTNFHDGDGGGHTTYLASLAKGLAARHGVFVCVAAPPGSRLLREASALPGVAALAQPFPNGLRRLGAICRAGKALAAHLREHAYDLIHVNGSADHRLILAAMRRLPSPPRLVLTKHNSKPMQGLGHWWRARRTDQVIAVSDYTRRALANTAYARCRLATVHNGIDTDFYAPWPADRARAERDARFPESPALVLGSNAGTADYKGWMDLVEAIALLPVAQREQVRVLLAGRPPSAASMARVDALGLRGQVHFAGLLDDVRPMIAAIDAGFVLSWDVETISFACREMMAMGKPVLVSEYAGLPENIRPGVDGWVTPVRDVAGIAAAIQMLLEQRATLPAMGEAARAHALEEFGIERFVDRTEAVYRELLAAE